jgi:protein-S-isoprenylcysteine O-methyltransferase Ste14
MNFVLAVFAIIVYVSFIAGVWLVFRKIQPDPIMLKILKVAALIAAVTYVIVIVMSTINVYQFAVGFSLYSISLLLFLWASTHTKHNRLFLAFSEEKPKHLLSDGPWKYVRHPFYTAYLLSYIAGTVSSGALWTIGIFVCMAIIYFLAAQYEERNFAVSNHSKEWLSWKAKTGMFFPWPL